MVLVLAYLPVLKRKWLVQLGMGGHNSHIQNLGIAARIVKLLGPDDDDYDSLGLKD